MDKEQKIIRHYDFVEGCAWTEAGDHLPFLGNESENGNETTEYSDLCRVITKTSTTWAFYGLVKITGKEVWRGWAEALAENYQPCLADYKRRISSRYHGGDYYTFLRRIGYASDPRYAAKVRRIAGQ